MSAFMAQSGNLVVLGDAGDALGNSIYEARLFVRGKVKSLGADCIEKEMRPEHEEIVAALLEKAGAERREAAAISAATARRESSTISTSTTPMRIEAMTGAHPPPCGEGGCEEPERERHPEPLDAPSPLPPPSPARERVSARIAS